MFEDGFGQTHRRGFLGRIAAAAVAVVAAEAAGSTSVSASIRRSDSDAQDTSDKWLAGLTGKHRQLFDMPDPGTGFPQLHIRNYYATYHDAYGVAEKEINTVGTLYGKSTLCAFNDSMWAKYKFGATIGVMDAKKVPLTRNMFAHPQEGDNFAAGFFDSSIEALQKKGALFILCNNATNFWSRAIAQAAGSTQEAVRKDLLANTLPGVVLVPGMVVAIDKAQKAGLTYMYLA